MDFALIGNCQTAALVDRRGRIIWWCFPRFDSDPVFSRLLAGDEEKGFCEVALADLVEVKTQYLRNTAVVETILVDARGGQVRVVDFAPLFDLYGRTYRAPQIVRRIEPIAGLPRITIKVRPTCNYGERVGEVSAGSHHIRYISGGAVVRLTTDAPISYIVAETSFPLHRTINLVFGQDDPVRDADRRHLPRIPRPHLRPLARVDAPSQRAVRMAVGGGARRDHAQAVRLRGHRRHRRRPHDVDPGGAGHVAQLGLPLLLAARRLLRRSGAQSPRRDAYDGILHPLFHHHRHARSGRAAAGARRRAVHQPRGEDHAGAEGLSRLRAGAHRQSGGGTGPTRFLRQRRARRGADVRRRAADPHGRRHAVRRARDARREGVESRLRARRRHLGISRQHAGPHLFRRFVLGRVRPARAHRAHPRPRRTPAALGVARRGHPRTIARRRVERKARRVDRRDRLARSRRQRSAVRRTRPAGARGPAVPQHLSRRSGAS